MTATCLLCGKSNVQALFEKAGISYYECKSCSFIFSTPTKNLNLEQTINEYEPSYQSYLAEQSSDRLNFKATLSWMESFRPLSNASVTHLDVGAGSGKFIDFIRTNRPCHCTGIEPSRAIYDTFCLFDKGIECKELVDFSQTTDQRFDVITAFDVLEHLPNPCEFFENSSKLMKPGGYLFISTPDKRALVPKILGKHWHHYNAYHLSYFDRSVIVGLAHKYGFEIVEFSHKAKKISLTYLLNYTKEFLFGMKSAPLAPVNQNELTIPINLFDIMYVVFKRRD
jgi:2-polyprenyl-3-methyl-5-hydroxy-6-metoxy-1,4-benzoquinol methylase